MQSIGHDENDDEDEYENYDEDEYENYNEDEYENMMRMIRIW